MGCEQIFADLEKREFAFLLIGENLRNLWINSFERCGAGHNCTDRLEIN